LLFRIRLRQLLAILLYECLVSLRNCGFLRRREVLFREQKLQAAAQLQFDCAERVKNLLRQLLDSLRIADCFGVAGETLESSHNLLKLPCDRVVSAQTVLDFANLVQPLLKLALPLPRIVRTRTSDAAAVIYGPGRDST